MDCKKLKEIYYQSCEKKLDSFSEYSYQTYPLVKVIKNSNCIRVMEVLAKHCNNDNKIVVKDVE